MWCSGYNINTTSNIFIRIKMIDNPIIAVLAAVGMVCLAFGLGMKIGLSDWFDNLMKDIGDLLSGKEKEKIKTGSQQRKG